jgi:hypothetical protein
MAGLRAACLILESRKRGAIRKSDEGAGLAFGRDVPLPVS